MPDPEASPNIGTLASYETGAARWAEQTRSELGPAKLAFLQLIVREVPPPAQVLELGSGTGRDALWFEQAGYTVQRTDGTQAFVDLMTSVGHRARRLNILEDPMPAGADLIYASAVLLHLTRDELAGVLDRTANAIAAGGWLAFTVKEGVGAEWSTAKIGPRYFRYWSAEELTAVLAASAWEPRHVTVADGLKDRWIHALCRMPTNDVAAASA